MKEPPDDLEEIVRYVKTRPQPSAGEMYVRKLLANPRAESIKAGFSRAPVLDLWSEIPTFISVLTMPGLYWSFEHELLARRREKGLDTLIHGVEIDRAIFRLSGPNIPKESHEDLVWVDNRTVRSNVAWFECRKVEWVVKRRWTWDCAWIDWNGPLMRPKLEAIVNVWPRLSHSLVLTFMGSRYHAHVKRLLHGSGGWGPLVASLLKVKRAQVTEESYVSGSSKRIIQVTVLK